MDATTTACTTCAGQGRVIVPIAYCIAGCGEIGAALHDCVAGRSVPCPACTWQPIPRPRISH